ncbi:protein AMN1 homolog [Anoplophora glabripennis]|uniref:protein AMN1 homolog n=1 Tax=Anoplophora glabripennis TaxID=217634 RepID=UPI0008747D28|nr:protein AMN1 homolog [Anoplophora glabripennis]
MVTENWRSSIGSLLSLSIEYIVNNLAIYANGNIEQLKALPPNIKNRILRKFTTCSYFWQNVNFKDVLCATVNDKTSHINLTSATVDDDVLNILNACKNVKKLYLTRTGGTQITNTVLKNLLKCTNQLCLFVITNCEEVNDGVLECLTDHCSHLMGLDVGGCKNVTDDGVKRLSTLKNLTWLTFSQTQISDEGISFLVKGSSGKNIRELRIDNCPNVTELGLKLIAENCPSIETLMFYNCSTDRDQIPFQEGQFKNLKQLTWTITW